MKRWLSVAAVLLTACSSSAERTNPPEATGVAPGRDTGGTATARRGEQGGRWESRGIGGGGALYGPSINPFDGDEIYMATDMSGLFHTTDFGAHWATLPFRTVQGCTATSVQWTADPDLLFAINDGPDDNPLLAKSTDRGRSWTTLHPSSDSTYALSVDPSKTGRFLASDTNNLYLSADAGATFRTVYTTASSNGLVLGGALWRDADIFVGTSDGLLVSRDHGATFALSSVGGIPPGESIVSFTGAHAGRTTRFYAVTSTGPYPGMTGGDVGGYGGAYQLTDGEPSWTALAVGLAPTEALSFVASSQNDVNVAYLAGSNQSSDESTFDIVYKTMDGGRSWKPALLTDDNANIATGWAGAGGWAGLDVTGNVMGLGVSPNDANRVVITDYMTVHTSRDGGETWRAAYVAPTDLTPPGELTPLAKRVETSGVEDTSVWSMTWASPRTIFTSITDVRSVWSDDDGRSWIRAGDNGLSLNTTYHAVKSASSGKLYAGTSSKHDLYQSSTLTDDPIDFATGAIMVSSDDGAHFETLEDIGHPVIFLALDPHAPNLLYASVVHSQVGGIYRKDLSAPATPAVRLAAPPRTIGHPFDIWVLNDGSLLASYSAERSGTHAKRGPFSESSGVFLSTDGGASWSDRSDPRMHYWTQDVVLDPHDQTQSTWYAGVFDREDEGYGGLYRTKDRGLSWTRLAGPLRVESFAVHPTRPDVGYYTTETNGLWVTENLSAAQPTFRLVEDYPFRQPYRVFFNPYDPRETWVTSFGGGMRVMTDR